MPLNGGACGPGPQGASPPPPAASLWGGSPIAVQSEGGKLSGKKVYQTMGERLP